MAGAGHATATARAVPQGAWTVIPECSRVGFAIRHLAVATVRGRFREFAGTLNAADPAAPWGEGRVVVASIDTGEPVRDERLRGPDYFDAARHPEIRFATSAVERAGAELQIAGDLEIKGTVRRIILSGRAEPAGRGEMRLELRGEVRRSEFGVESRELLEAGVADRVRLELDLVLALR